MTAKDLREMLEAWPDEAQVVIKHNGGTSDIRPLKGARLEHPEGATPGAQMDIARSKVVLA